MLRNKIINIISIILLLSSRLQAQEYTLSGYIQDAQSGEKLIGANLYFPNLHKGTSSNNFGFYSIRIPKDEKLRFVCSYVGYQIMDTLINSSANLQQNILLTPVGVKIEEVTVAASKSQNNEQFISKAEISMAEIKKLPSLTGEVDVIKSFMLMPGITMGNEGTNGLFVRGGNLDQNLVLLDDVNLYSFGHLGGFVSVFDENAINKMEIIKGGFPARYGGRLSSVVDIRMKDGNLFQYKGNIHFGVLDSKIMLQGPIKKGKTSFFFSIRKSMTDLYLLAATQKINGGKLTSSYSFYDMNAKIHHKISRKDNLYLSMYSGKDILKYTSQMHDAAPYDSSMILNSNLILGNNWGNTIYTFRWNHLWSDRIFSNLTLAHNDYFFHINSLSHQSNSSTGKILQAADNSFQSGIKDEILKLDFEYYLNNNLLRWGVGTTYHRFSPGTTHLYFDMDSGLYPDSIIEKYNLPQRVDSTWGTSLIKNMESYAYIEDQMNLGKLALDFGLYFSAYKAQKLFTSLEPRLAANYSFNENSYIKTSFSLMRQNLHMLAANASQLPTNLWIPADTFLVPEESWQGDLSFVHYFQQQNYKLEIAAFYKKQNNLIDFKMGETFSAGNLSWQNKLVNKGQAQIYGLEFLLHKNQGKLKGWISYTLSKNQRQFAQINHGASFPFTFDRTHDLSIVLMYQIKPNIHFTANWNYCTGSRMSLASAKYPMVMFNSQQDYQPLGVNIFHYRYEDAYIYGSKNNFKLPDYHRLDIGFSFEKKKKRGIRTWNIGIYNVYNRHNAYYVYFKKDYNDRNKLKMYQFSLIPIFPSFGYSFSF